MPRKSIPVIPVGELRVHEAHSVFRLFRGFNQFFFSPADPVLLAAEALSFRGAAPALGRRAKRNRGWIYPRRGRPDPARVLSMSFFPSSCVRHSQDSSAAEGAASE